MSIPRSVAEVLRDPVVLEVEAFDRMYLNVCVPHLQSVGAVVGYLRVHRGQRFASTAAVTPMTEAFVRNIDQFITTHLSSPVSARTKASGKASELNGRCGYRPRQRPKTRTPCSTGPMISGMRS
jgi:hypothetical protein